MIYTRPEMESSGLAYYFAKYHPYRVGGARNPDFNTFSGLILDLKEAKEKGLIYFHNRLDPLIAKGVVVCCVPSSNPAKTLAGIRVFSKLLAKNGRVDGTSCLVRTKYVPKAASGGPRNVQVHLDSIELRNAHLVTGAEVLLLDDVTTSGSSLDACEQILRTANPANLRRFALSDTHG